MEPSFVRPSRSWPPASVAAVLALTLVVVVMGLVACSSLQGLPTLAPTRSLPTTVSNVGAVPAPSPVPASVFSTADHAVVVPYDFDPASGKMVPADRISGVATGTSNQIWVVLDNAFVEYRRPQPAQPSDQASDDDLVAFKVITYTYDSIGRRVGWTVTWPLGPTETQQLSFLYEGLVTVGERLEVGGLVTTTYYPWAARDRNTTVDAAQLASDAPITDVTRYDSRCQAAAGLDCSTMLARIIVSESSVGNEDEQRAVAWTFRNRLDRGLSLLSYAMDRLPNREWYFELARDVLTSPVDTDVTRGATHFFSPRSMPRQGEEDRCKSNGGIYDCDGGLVFVEGLDEPAYAPFWHLLYEWLPVAGIRKTHFLFYRIPPIQPRLGE